MTVVYSIRPAICICMYMYLYVHVPACTYTCMYMYLYVLTTCAACIYYCTEYLGINSVQFIIREVLPFLGDADSVVHREGAIEAMACILSRTIA